MLAQTFAATYKLALEHFKKEVSAGFVVFILKKLLDMHNIEEDDFKAELMTRYSTVSATDVCFKNTYQMSPFRDVLSWGPFG